MRQTTLFVKSSLLLLLTISFSSLFAQVDLELSLVAEKPFLAEGEQGKFTFTLSNTGTTDAADVVVVLFSLSNAEYVDMDATDSNYFAAIKAGESASFERELISRSPSFQFYAEIVNGSNGDPDSQEFNIDRCRASIDCPDGAEACIYNCALEDDEVVYPQPMSLEILGVSCPSEFPTVGENLNFELTVRNNSSVVSAPINLSLYQSLRAIYTPIDPAPYQLSEATLPSIEANSTASFSLTYAYNPYPEDTNDFNTITSTYFSFDSNGLTEDYEVDIACQKTTTDIAIAAIATPETFGTDEIMSYRVEVTNNGDEVARVVRVKYASEMSGFQNSFDGLVLSMETDFAGSNFVDYNNLNFGTSEKYWDIDRLEVGETAILNVRYQISGDIVEEFIDAYTISVNVSSDFVNDADTSNDRAEVSFERGVSTFIDLELNMSAQQSPLVRYAPNTVIVELQNKGNITATNIEVDLDLSDRSQAVLVGEFMAVTSLGRFRHVPSLWMIESLEAGETATLEVQYFPLVEFYTPYAQVSKADQDDLDSTPGNGTCCTPNEDDEAHILPVNPNPFALINVENKLRVYPNPTQDALQISGTYEAETPYIIYDLLGKNLQEGQLQDGVLEVRHLPSGTYFLKMQNTGVSPIRFVML